MVSLGKANFGKIRRGFSQTVFGKYTPTVQNAKSEEEMLHGMIVAVIGHKGGSAKTFTSGNVAHIHSLLYPNIQTVYTVLNPENSDKHAFQNDLSLRDLATEKCDDVKFPDLMKNDTLGIGPIPFGKLSGEALMDFIVTKYEEVHFNELLDEKTFFQYVDEISNGKSIDEFIARTLIQSKTASNLHYLLPGRDWALDHANTDSERNKRRASLQTKTMKLVNYMANDRLVVLDMNHAAQVSDFKIWLKSPVRLLITKLSHGPTLENSQLLLDKMYDYVKVDTILEVVNELSDLANSAEAKGLDSDSRLSKLLRPFLEDKEYFINGLRTNLSGTVITTTSATRSVDDHFYDLLNQKIDRDAFPGLDAKAYLTDLYGQLDQLPLEQLGFDKRRINKLHKYEENSRGFRPIIPGKTIVVSSDDNVQDFVAVRTQLKLIFEEQLLKYSKIPIDPNVQLIPHHDDFNENASRYKLAAQDASARIIHAGIGGHGKFSDLINTTIYIHNAIMGELQK